MVLLHDDKEQGTIQGSAFSLACGLRNGYVAVLRLEFDHETGEDLQQRPCSKYLLNFQGIRLSVTSQEVVRIGDKPAKVFTDTSTREKAFLACGAELYRIHLEYGGRNIGLHTVWLTDNNLGRPYEPVRNKPSNKDQKKPDQRARGHKKADPRKPGQDEVDQQLLEKASVQDAVIAVLRLPLSTHPASTRPRQGLACLKGQQLFVFRLDEYPKEVNHSLEIAGTPNRVLYSRHLNCLVVAFSMPSAHTPAFNPPNGPHLPGGRDVLSSLRLVNFDE